MKIRKKIRVLWEHTLTVPRSYVCHAGQKYLPGSLQGVYALDLLVAVGVFVLSNLRGFWAGMGFTDYVQNILFIIERPFRGIAYFFALQAIGKALLILMDMEDNTRRAARK